MTKAPERQAAHLGAPADDLPEGWINANLGEVCEVNPPKPPADALSPQTLVTFVPMPAVDADSGAIVNPATRPFTQARKGYTAFREGDVIMAKITPCMENGKAARAVGLLNGLGFGSTEFHVLRPTSGIHRDFVYHFIRQESYRKEAEGQMTGSVGQKRVPTDFIENTELHLPPLPEQRRIVEKIEELLVHVNASREHLAKVPKILKPFRQSVLAAACSGRLTEDWREAHPDIEPAEDLLTRIAEYRHTNSTRSTRTTRALPKGASTPFDLPKSWTWAAFGILMGELRNGISTRPEQEPPGQAILRISSVRVGRVLLDDRRYLPNSDNLVATYQLRNNDLLFTRYNGSLDLLGVCGMVRGLGNEVLLYPDKLMRVRIDHPFLLPSYTEIYFGSPPARDSVTGKSKSSAGQQGVSGADIKAQPVALPPLEEQHEIVRRVEALFGLADKIEKRVEVATTRADKLTQSILAKAFRGELVPTEAELAGQEGRDYETASQLLNRIRASREAEPTKYKTPRRKGRPTAAAGNN